MLAPMKLSYLIRGIPGHPLHPPLTDVTIGSYTVALVAGFLDVTGISNSTAAHAWWIALLIGLAATVLTALTGLADWLTITPGTPLWRTATWHAVVNVTAVVLFGIAALFGHDDWYRGSLAAWEYAVTVVAFAVLLVGGWLGGAITFVHGMRVLNLVEEPAARAAAPYPTPEKKEAAES
jgi:uncharacterized membrane protein